MRIIIWEIHVKPGMESAFEEAYHSQGDWAQLFRRADGFVSTELASDPNNPQRYITIDRWRSPAAHEEFLSRYRSAYEALDKECANLTEHESLLGEFDLVENEN